jgi:hypothetical protein
MVTIPANLFRLGLRVGLCSLLTRTSQLLHLWVSPGAARSGRWSAGAPTGGRGRAGRELEHRPTKAPRWHQLIAASTGGSKRTDDSGFDSSVNRVVDYSCSAALTDPH